MSRELYEELVGFAIDGPVCESSWMNLFHVKQLLDGGNELILDRMREAAWSVARYRKCRLPDSLHNMMILCGSHRCVAKYLRMLSKLGPAQI